MAVDDNLIVTAIKQCPPYGYVVSGLNGKFDVAVAFPTRQFSTCARIGNRENTHQKQETATDADAKMIHT
jgi:hypothetical protein